MIPAYRQTYNETFTEEKYQQYINDMNAVHPGAIEFKVAETPVFVPTALRNQMLETCESIIDLVLDPSFKANTERAIPLTLKVANEKNYPHFLVFDFGVCKNEAGELEPQLIEMQGFATLFGFQVIMADMIAKHLAIPNQATPYLSGLDRSAYISLLKETLIGNHSSDNVVLLELFPHEQKTKIDFYCTRDFTGINIICLTDLIKDGNKLYYLLNGVKTAIHRIYNRIIFDELLQQSPEIQNKGKILFEELDVEWLPHPSWFYRISKFTLPFIHHPFVPTTYFLNEVKQMPKDLENYVLKPLFSFAGQGVLIDITLEDIENISDPENWILQRKVTYADCIATPDGPAKAEIRIFYFWQDGAARPIAVNNLARISKGKMIGVNYNKDKTWVGGSLCFFEP